MTNKSGLPGIVLVLWLLMGAVPSQAAQVRGVVRLEGPIPAREVVTIQAKQGEHSTQGCGSLTKASQKLAVNPSGGIQNVVVWLDLPIQGESDASRHQPLLDQQACLFSPHVVAIAPGREVGIRNSDAILHNVRIFREGNPSMLMHQWQKADASDIRWRFNEPGRYIVRCGIHPWMYAWVAVVPGASAVTDEAGRFSIAGVAPGTYTLHLWHETLGVREVPIHVGSKEENLKPIVWAGSGGS